MSSQQEVQAVIVPGGEPDPDQGLMRFRMFDEDGNPVAFATENGDGLTGPPGPAGARGPAGVPGNSGYRGPQGEQGPMGPQGNQGLLGAPGPRGPMGPQGVSDIPGPTGPSGPAGGPGVKGDKGDKGDTGSIGPEGPLGLKGETGAKGEKGDTGISGVPGNQGPPGASGPEGTRGPQGTPGVPGTAGATGPAGAPGSAGPTGLQGPQGLKGDTGAQGAAGPSGQAAGKIFYAAPSDASDISGYKTILESPSTGPEQTITTVCTGTNTDFLVAVFATDPGIPGAVDFPAGTGFRRIYASLNSGTARLHLQVYKRSAAGVETLIRDEMSNDFSDQVVASQMWVATTAAAGALLATDRLVAKLYAQRVTGGGGTVTVTTYYEGSTHASQIQSTISAGAQGPVGPQGPQGAQGSTGPQGTQGPQGTTGATGSTGATGPGVAAGGTTDQVLAKASATDYATKWIDPAAGGGGSSSPGDFSVGGRLLIPTPGQVAGILLGADANLYRSAASELTTDGTLKTGGSVTSGGGGFRNSALATYAFQGLQGAANPLLVNYLTASDGQPSARMLGSGKMEWGAGGSTAPDTNLYRSGPNALQTDDALTVQATIHALGLDMNGNNITALGNPGNPSDGANKAYVDQRTGAVIWTTQNPSAASSVTFSSLVGDTDEAYEVLVEGMLASGGTQRRLTLRPNNITTNTRSIQWDSFRSGDAAPTAENLAADNLGMLLGTTFGTAANTTMLCRGIFRVKSGVSRLWNGTYTCHDNALATATMAQGLLGGVWLDSTPAVTSLVVDFGGGTFTGRVSIRKAV